MAKYYTTCASCGKRIDDNTSPCDEEGNSYCDKCADVMQSVCSICGNTDYLWNMTSTSQDEIYCEHCATAIA